MKRCAAAMMLILCAGTSNADDKAKPGSEKEPPPRVDLLRFYDKRINEHIYTYGEGEPANWRLRKELIGETIVGRVALTKEPGTVPLFRGVRPDGRHYFYLKKPREMKDFRLEEFHVYVWTNGGDGRVPIHGCMLPDAIDLYLDTSQKKVNEFTAGTLKGTGIRRKVMSRLFYVYPAQTGEEPAADGEKADGELDEEEEEEVPAVKPKSDEKANSAGKKGNSKK